jgi:hypothetical protein
MSLPEERPRTHAGETPTPRWADAILRGLWCAGRLAASEAIMQRMRERHGIVSSCDVQKPHGRI